MLSLLLNLIVAGSAIAINIEGVQKNYNSEPASVTLNGSGYISAFTLWQSPSAGVNISLGDILPEASCNMSHSCLLNIKTDSAIFDPQSYTNGDNYFFSLEWSNEQSVAKTDIQITWSQNFSISAGEDAEEHLDLRDEEIQSTETSIETVTATSTSASSALSSIPEISASSEKLVASAVLAGSTISASITLAADAVLATGQTFAAINPIILNITLYEEAAVNNVDAINATATSAASFTAVAAIATQSVDGLLRSPISTNTSGILTVPTTSQMTLATLSTATATATPMTSVAPDTLGAASMIAVQSFLPISVAVLFGIWHIWL